MWIFFSFFLFQRTMWPPLRPSQNPTPELGATCELRGLCSELLPVQLWDSVQNWVGPTQCSQTVQDLWVITQVLVGSQWPPGSQKPEAWSLSGASWGPPPSHAALVCYAEPSRSPPRDSKKLESFSVPHDRNWRPAQCIPHTIQPYYATQNLTGPCPVTSSS